MSDTKPDIIIEFPSWDGVGVVGYTLDANYTREKDGSWKKKRGDIGVIGKQFVAEIKRLTTLCQNLVGEETLHQEGQYETEMMRLQAIVNALDRTDDGIPITPRMEVWRTGTITYSNGAVVTITAQRRFAKLTIPGGEFVGSVHSTREAALAAKETE